MQSKKKLLETTETAAKKIITKNNFFKNTYCVFKGVPLYKISRRKINYRSDSGSTYYYTKTGVYRLANHWGRAATCNWRLVSEIPVEIDNLRLGYADWIGFKENFDQDMDTYYISIDFETNIVSYQHKDNPSYDQKAIIRSVDATRKLIRQIKNLLTTYKWAKYYEYDDLETFRKKIVLALINSNKSLLDLKKELAEGSF